MIKSSNEGFVIVDALGPQADSTWSMDGAYELLLSAYIMTSICKVTQQ